MNPEYAKGYILILDATARISSTFGGHYDLAAYLVLMMPVTLACLFYFKNKWWYFLIFFISVFTLVLTASRVSYGAYIVSTMLFLLLMRKFKMLFVAILITVGLTLTSGNLTSRLTRTFQQKQVFIDKQTGQTTVPRKLDPAELPVGDFVPNTTNLTDITAFNLNSKDGQQALAQIRQEIRDEAFRNKRSMTREEEDALVAERLKNLQVVTTMLPDISFSTRLQVEWPRAIKAFLKNPILGKGPSSITEATDNDFLRWLGEFGLLGTLSFLAIFFIISKELWTAARQKNDESILFYGLLFGVGGLLINATYIDVFEASKIAYNFWMITGLFMGFLALNTVRTKEKRIPAAKKKAK
jgi:O-antigen ligase